MEVSRIRALRGPNLWSRHTALEAIVTCTEAERAIDTLPGFEPRVRSLFPAIGALRPGGYVGPISLAHVLESAALALQANAGCPVTFSHTGATLEPGVYQTVVEYSEEAVGRLALELAQALVHAALNESGFDVDAAIARLRGKIKYRPVIFELMPPEFTLTDLQGTVEAIAGRHVHKQNFRRLVEGAELVEPTGSTEPATGGRPAAFFRFRRQVLEERPAPGLKVGGRTSG